MVMRFIQAYYIARYFTVLFWSSCANDLCAVGKQSYDAAMRTGWPPRQWSRKWSLSMEKAAVTFSYPHVGHWARAPRVHVSSVWAVSHRVIRSRYVLDVCFNSTRPRRMQGRALPLTPWLFRLPGGGLVFCVVIFWSVVYSQYSQGKTPYRDV